MDGTRTRDPPDVSGYSSQLNYDICLYKKKEQLISELLFKLWRYGRDSNPRPPA